MFLIWTSEYLVSDVSRYTNILNWLFFQICGLCQPHELRFSLFYQRHPFHRNKFAPLRNVQWKVFFNNLKHQLFQSLLELSWDGQEQDCDWVAYLWTHLQVMIEQNEREETIQQIWLIFQIDEYQKSWFVRSSFGLWKTGQFGIRFISNDL